MNILASEINLPQGALEVYVAGCTRYCPGCHNPEAWEFNQGTPWLEWLEANEYKVDLELIRCVWVLGGEPLDQDHMELKLFLAQIRKPILLWTSYTDYPSWIRDYCFAIKTGLYREDLPLSRHSNELGIKLASSNQKIEVFR